MSTTSLEKRGLLVGFAVFGLFWGSWAAVLPDVRARSGLSDGRLGLALAAVAVAAVPVMPLAGRLMDRHGARRLLPALLLAFAAVTALLGFAVTPVALVGALVLLGAVTGMLDVVANAAVAAWERAEGSRLMAAGHGCFSTGVLVGAGLTGVARDLGAGPALVLGAGAVVVAGAALAQPHYRLVPSAGTQDRDGRRSPRVAPLLVGLGAVIAATFLVEDAVGSWSALHLERTLDAPPWMSGLGPGLFAGAMAAGRFGAHWFIRPGHDARVVGLGAAGLAAGLLVLALAPVPGVALAGAVLAGLGISVLAPTLLSAVGARSAPGRQGSDLALVTTFGYAGFVTGPVLVGLLSSALSLPSALALLAALAVVLAAAGPWLLGRPAPRREASAAL